MNKKSRNRDLIVKDNKLITSKYHLTLMQIKFISIKTFRISEFGISFFWFKLLGILGLWIYDEFWIYCSFAIRWTL